MKVSQVLFGEIGKAGGAPLMWKTCRFFFAGQRYGFDDALYTTVRPVRAFLRRALFSTITGWKSRSIQARCPSTGWQELGSSRWSNYCRKVGWPIRSNPEGRMVRSYGKCRTNWSR